MSRKTSHRNLGTLLQAPHRAQSLQSPDLGVALNTGYEGDAREQLPHHVHSRHKGCVIVGGVDVPVGEWDRSDAGDVGGEEVDAVSVKIAASSVVVLGCTGVGVAGEDLRITKGHAGI